MKNITPQILHDNGINLPAADEAAFIEHFEDTLSERVGQTVIDRLDDDKATEMLAIVAKGDGGELSAWLQLNVPDFEQIEQLEYDDLLAELKQHADKL